MATPTSRADTYFDVWGCRGSRTVFSDSSIGNLTSCYSLVHGETLCVIDGGRGLARLAAACAELPHLSGIRRVHILLTHAHMDHWEGLKDADWFWRPANGLSVTLYGCRETLETIRQGFAAPAFVPLETLAIGTLESFAMTEIQTGQTYPCDDVSVETFSLHHYSGSGDDKQSLDTLGFRITVGETTVAYLSDHEPTTDTALLEATMLAGSHLAVCDAHFADRRDHAYGHGSLESGAQLARLNPATRVLAAHHNPNSSDAEIEEAFARHAAGLGNFALAREGRGYVWNPEAGAFDLRPSS